MSDIIEPGLVVLDADLGPEKSGVIRALADRVAASGRATDAEALFADAWKREEQAPTGLPGGMAIPHAKSPAVTTPSLAVARLARPVEFDEGEEADLVFLIAAPDTAAQDHLALLSTLARSLMREDFVASLRSAATPDEVVGIVQGALTGDEEAVPVAAAAAAPAAATADAPPADAAAASDRRSIVAVTACPTGIAHTYMAADALAAAAGRAGVDYHVETQGSSGAKPLDPAVIAAADAVIFAVDVDVRDKGRFAGKPMVQVPVKRGIDEPDALVAQALAAASDANAARVPSGGDGAAATAGAASGGGQSFGANLKRWLLTGVSYMIPFVAAGGLIIALAFLIGGYEIGDNAAEIVLNNALWNLPPGGLSEYIGSVLIVIGSASMAFLVPALAGYIAYAMADRPGIAPGFVAGSVALVLNAGFLGGLVGGLLAGAAAMWLGRLRPPRWLRGLMPVVIIPLLASLFSSGLLLLILGAPIATLMAGLTDWLNSLTGVSAIALGAILGLMMGFDLGGPVNKVAYAFAVTGLAAGSVENQAPWQIMAAVMAAGMVPPLGMAFASTVLARRLFTEPERENGVAAWLLGLSFISEGAIPFAAADPLRVIASSMVGGATAGAICMAAGVTSQAPHGGIFVFFAIGNFGMFLVAILVGTLVMGFMVVGLKRWARRAPVAVEEGAAVPAGAAVATA
ncbi:PTS system D-fructose-specific IIA component (F1P-forming) (Frc family) /PTS system D-fructose-specific IIB component (F1P-forming) (Frc family) /PTS system D-fructose-specific IIC component (F1P-forming) (Frc family) [Agromyces ramosus]|uniref:PTS system D-fructose-specific IIA component (F1P-forming) (Frc family) /PTS system D-fructose-specific IIB component (F1P-forming) (Frc family) /PTS system D-fructose-specific IIC component (F1P-f... n=1 Tax=Agromyces ramosus TaxID=33879 RepID=A0A4Q7M8J9_9MICO|nr:fructose-specific PTS transporter subunit EIIC [Agromyces ramosus]RZS64336.1 PTS system D-fructose-specific IIA component (F1P-forming) (Frc family) /PTS system D-fructose-specific IIB component (F1P-forming) (Frc family) /PTS system D-fructose-specific IIC component (F1P-forming) (Frc family) [Agromyces ramosus]